MDFKSGKKSITSLFSCKKQFVIPRFQREYTWSKVELNEFLDDILTRIELHEGASEVWAEEISVVRDVVEMSSNIEETDLSDEDTARTIGELLDTSKESQILGSSTISIADSILKDAYSGIDGYDAPEVDENTNFAEEFAKLQALLAAQGE